MDAPTRNLLIMVQLCFGVFPWLGKVAMEAFEPRAVMVWRLAVGSAVLLLLAALRHGRQVFPPRRDLAALFGLSLLGITINQLCFLEGLSRSTAVNAGLLMTVIPVATLGLAVVLGHERTDRRRQLGIALSVGGVAWLFMSRGASVDGSTLLGDALLILNCVSYSAYLVLAKPVLRRLPQPVVLAWLFTFGLLTVPWFSLGVPLVPVEVEGRHWAALAGVLLLPTVLAYVGNIVVLSRTHASTTAAYVMLQPFVAAGLGIGLLGERPEASLLVTAAGVLVGLWLVSTPGAGAVLTRPGVPASSTDPPSGRIPPR